jgi:hypothetical protein
LSTKTAGMPCLAKNNAVAVPAGPAPLINISDLTLIIMLLRNVHEFVNLERNFPFRMLLDVFYH